MTKYAFIIAESMHDTWTGETSVRVIEVKEFEAVTRDDACAQAEDYAIDRYGPSATCWIRTNNV